MKSIAIAIIYTLLALQSISAQTITIKDKSSMQVIPGVQVNSGVTDLNGQITLNGILIKNDSLIECSKVGYFSESFNLAKLKSMGYIVLLSEKSYDLNAFVVSASKFEEKSKDVAQQTAVIDRRQIEFYAQPNTADVLQQTGRVFVQKSQMGGGSIAMRGFEANKVLMVVDGVRMNNAIYRGGHLQNVLTVDNNMLERTELVFGPGSVVYGSDALGGVVHFYTLNPKLSSGNKPFIRANAFTRYGTAMDQKTGHFNVNIGFRKWAFLSSASYSEFGDMRMGQRGTKGYESWGRRTFVTRRVNGKDSMVVHADSFRQTPTGYTQWDLMQKILYRQNAFVSHLINFQHSNSSDVPRYDRLTELNPVGMPSQAEWYYGPQTRTMASYKLSVDRKTVAFEKASLLLAYQDIKESRHNRGFGSSNKTHRSEQVKVWTFNADFQKDIGPKSELRYGAEFTHNAVQSSAYKENINTGLKSPQSTRYPDGGSIMRSSAVYVTQNTYFSKHLILNTGIRFTNTYLKSLFIDKTFFPFLANQIEQLNQNSSGNIGLVWLGKHDLKVSGTLSTGFRAANVDDMGKVFESAGGRVIIPNADVNPEQTTTLDLTVNKTWKKKLNMEVNGYFTRFSNALTVGRSQLNGKDTIVFEGVNSTIYSMQNAQNARIYGTYAGLSYDASKSLSISASVNYTYGRISTDSTDYPLDHISPVFGRIGLVYKHRKWKAEAFGLFNGPKRSADYNLVGEDNAVYSADPINGYTPAWYTMNIRGFYQINKSIQMHVSIENIIDQHYRTFSSGYSAPGRNFVFTIKGSF